MARRTELDDLVDELAASQHGAFSLRQLGPMWCDRRLAAKRVVRGEWYRVVNGTFLLPGAIDDWSIPAAMCLHVPGAALGWAAAAIWWGLDGVPSAPVHLLAPRTCPVRHRLLRSTSDLAGWESVLDRPDGCLRVTDATRTLIDLGAIATPDELERAAESALRKGLTTVPRLRTRACQLRRPGRAGPAALLAVLDRRPAGGHADSEGEVPLLQLLRAAGLPDPIRQYRVGSTRFDLAWPDAKVIVELDGDTHRSRERQRRDARTQNRVVLDRWTVLRFTWDRIELEPDVVVREVALALAMSP